MSAKSHLQPTPSHAEYAWQVSSLLPQKHPKAHAPGPVQRCPQVSGARALSSGCAGVDGSAAAATKPHTAAHTAHNTVRGGDGMVVQTLPPGSKNVRGVCALLAISCWPDTLVAEFFLCFVFCFLLRPAVVVVWGMLGSLAVHATVLMALVSSAAAGECV